MEAARLVEQTSNIFDESIPNDSTPVLQPTPWRPSNVTTKDKQNIKKIIIQGMQKIKDFSEWLLSYIPPKPKVVDKVLESFKNKIKKVRKAGYFVATNTGQICFEEFAIQYRIIGLNRYDPESFLLNCKQPITILMINTRQTKVKLILSCMMEKVDLKSGEVIAKGSVSF